MKNGVGISFCYTAGIRRYRRGELFVPMAYFQYVTLVDFYNRSQTEISRVFPTQTEMRNPADKGSVYYVGAVPPKNRDPPPGAQGGGFDANPANRSKHGLRPGEIRADLQRPSRTNISHS